MNKYFDDYIKHSVLNFGQAAQGIRYFYSHPDIDGVSKRGTLAHCLKSILLRSTIIINDLFFAILPPTWHHTAKELEAFHDIPISRWFQYGYCAWRFTEIGEVKSDLSNVDKRWDPRCKKAEPVL